MRVFPIEHHKQLKIRVCNLPAIRIAIFAAASDGDRQALCIVALVAWEVASGMRFSACGVGLWLGGRLMRSHMEAAGAREEL